MANWALPSLTSTYTNFVQEVSNRDISCAKWFNSATVADTNLPTGVIRWNNTNKNWEEWSGSVWNTLSVTYGISITGYSSHLVGGNNTTLLGSIPYQSNTNTTTLLSPNTTVTKKFLVQTGTGTNGAAPSWGTIVVADVTGAAPLASPTFTGTPSLPTGTTGVTQTVGDSSTKLATTAFVIANGTPLASSPNLPVINGIQSAGVGTAASRWDHVHPIDTSRAAVGQTFFIGTTQVAINRGSAALNLTGINIDGSSGSCTGNAATATYATNAGSATARVGSLTYSGSSYTANATTWTLLQFNNWRISTGGITYPGNGQLQVSVAGYYRITYGAVLVSGVAGNIHMMGAIYINGSPVEYVGYGLAAWYYMTGTVVRYLNAGDIVSIYVYGSNAILVHANQTYLSAPLNTPLSQFLVEAV